MTKEQLQKEGWIQTDGSAATLQYAKQINPTTWLYRQWVDKFDIQRAMSIPVSAEYKVANWNSDQWIEAKLNLLKYTEKEITRALETFGYYLFAYRTGPGNGQDYILEITDGDTYYNQETSIMLTCECIFETTEWN